MYKILKGYKCKKNHTHIMKYQYTIQIAITKNSIANLGKDADTNHLHIAGKNANNIAILENSWANLLKTKYALPPVIPLTGISPT